MLISVFHIPLQERHRIDVDCRRTDRTQPLFSAQTGPSQEDDGVSANRHHSSISPNLEDIGAQSPSNEHVERLSAVLLTYNFYEKELGETISFLVESRKKAKNDSTNVQGFEGYVQGMSDLCAPIYIVMGADQEMTFWCFVQVMNRMVCRPVDNLCER